LSIKAYPTNAPSVETSFSNDVKSNNACHYCYKTEDKKSKLANKNTANLLLSNLPTKHFPLLKSQNQTTNTTNNTIFVLALGVFWKELRQSL